MLLRYKAPNNTPSTSNNTSNKVSGESNNTVSSTSKKSNDVYSNAAGFIENLVTANKMAKSMSGAQDKNFLGESNNTVSSTSKKSNDVYSNAAGFIENLVTANKMAKSMSGAQDKNFLGLPYYVTAAPKAKLQPGEYKVVLTAGDTKTPRISPLAGRKPVIESVKTGLNAKEINAVNDLNKILNIIPDLSNTYKKATDTRLKNKVNELVDRITIKPTPKRLDQFILNKILNIIPDLSNTYKKATDTRLKNKVNELVDRITIKPTPKRLDQFIEDKILNIIPDLSNTYKKATDTRLKNKVNELVDRITIKPTPKRLDQFIEDQIPGGLVYGNPRKKLEREYQDIFYPAIEREQNKMQSNLESTLQHDINQKRVANADAIRTRQVVLAENTKRQVDKQIALAVADMAQQKKPLDTNSYKAKQTMYNKLFNQRYYDMQDAIRNRELPHKKSNKKKKTSKDNRVKRREWGGLLFKDGGLIPKFQSPAGPIRMQAKTKNYFDRNAGLSGYNIGADIDEFLKHGTAEDYVIGFNGREDNYDALVKASKGTYGNRSYISNPLATTVQSAMLTYNPGFDKYIRQNIQGYGVTEGQGTGTDKYFGDRTWERTLGRNITAEQAKYFNDTYLKQRGIEMYDKGDGGYRLRLIPASNQVTTGLKNDTQKNGTEVDDSVVGNSSKTDRPKGFLRNIKINPENLSAFGRMLGGIYTNNKAAEIYKQGLKPTLLETFENTVPIQGNYLSIYNANQIADNLNNLAAKARTSDAALQLAGELEANNRAGQISLQGGLQDAEMFYKTRMLGQQESDAAKARRVEVSNANRASINQIAAAKKQIDSAKITSNYQNVIAPYLMEKEHTIKQNKALANQLVLENFTLNQFDKYKQELNDLKNTYANDTAKLQEEINKLDLKYKNIINTKKLEFLSNPYLVQFSKSGSKLSYADRAKLQRAKDFNKRLLSDNKQFHKNISESKKEHNKLIMNMSALTAALIKKGMRV